VRPQQRILLATGQQRRRPGWCVLTQQRGRAFSPLGGEIAQGVLLLRGPGLERGLLPELPHQLRRRLPPVLRNVLVDQPVFDLLNIASTGRELIHQLLRHANNFPRRGAPRTALTGFPPDAEDLSEVVREDRVVMLRYAGDGGVDSAGSECAPPRLTSHLHAVDDDNGREKLWIRGPTIVLIGGSRNHTAHGNSREGATRPFRADPGHRGVALE